jgi:hypothetical protein
MDAHLMCQRLAVPLNEYAFDHRKLFRWKQTNYADKFAVVVDEASVNGGPCEAEGDIRELL